VGGVSDIVTHQDNGYLAEPNNVDDLERGVRWVLMTDNNETERRRLHEGIRSKFAYPVVAAQHLSMLEASMKKGYEAD
jgi:glycosyltransferase involved in cell wall biosynthesis